MMQKEIIFASQKFYPLTDDDLSKLDNYDNLQSELNNLKSQDNPLSGQYRFDNGTALYNLNVNAHGITLFSNATGKKVSLRKNQTVYLQNFE